MDLVVYQLNTQVFFLESFILIVDEEYVRTRLY